ncbi:uncharacterized protein LOC34621415 [Cyclospora cayetanensis]|uniref:Uncharacterized protein LOC34621415 n=1 Tax=Cyclospora cayetanensis TaxID=88456 RepID=A0A6P6RV71_9EIME|nr:uncharacterized protein LOC34621415 [Cyclospora cayetanensis]
MQPSRRWFLAGGCWLMACLVAQGALRVASAVSISRSVGVASGASSASSAAASSAAARAVDGPPRSSGGSYADRGFSSSSQMPRVATNTAAAAAAAAAALAALYTGTLSLGVEGSAAGGGVHQGEAPSLADALSKGSREGAVAALEADRLNCDAEGCASYPAAAREGCASACTLADGWKPLGFAWRQRLRQEDLTLLRIEAGGWGDCLFLALSMAFGLNGMKEVAGDALKLRQLAANGIVGINPYDSQAGACILTPHGLFETRVWQTCAAKSMSKELNLPACSIMGGVCVPLSLCCPMWRYLYGRAFTFLRESKYIYLRSVSLASILWFAELSPKEEAAFLDRLAVMSALEDSGDWDDGWSPSVIFDGSEPYISSAGVIFDVSSTMGKVRAVHHELGRPGNNHWGTAADICALENELDVGILVLDGARGTFYVTGSENKRRQAYVLLYFKGACHFQLVGVQTPEGIKTLLYPEELPKALIRFFKEDTKHDLLGGSAVSDKSTKHLHDTDTAVRSNRQRG